jgi:hypothetical protein
MSFSEKPDRYPLAGNDVSSTRLMSLKDPYEMLDDLMVVVEALCPVWPSRTDTMSESDFRL